MLNRSDITSDPSDGSVAEGVPLRLTIGVYQAGADVCEPVSGAIVDVWQCDAFGVYSDVSGLGIESLGRKFLRGFQVTDDSGVVEFQTIYPGWYMGRTVHIHFKVRTERRPRVHVAVVLRRRPQRPGLHAGPLQHEGQSRTPATTPTASSPSRAGS